MGRRASHARCHSAPPHAHPSPCSPRADNTGDGGFCGSCICALVDVYLPAFRAANLTLGQSSALAAASSIIQARGGAAFPFTRSTRSGPEQALAS
jgi:hypothetical protein